MTGKSSSTWAIVVLPLLGIGLLILRFNLQFEAGGDDYRLTYKTEFHVEEPAPAGSVETADNNYRLTYTTEFHARKADAAAIAPNAELRAACPRSTRHCRVLAEEIDAPEMQRAAGLKSLVLRTAKTGPLKSMISFRIHLDPNSDPLPNVPAAPLTLNERTKYLANAKGMTANSKTAQEMVARLGDGLPGRQELVDRIFRECIQSIEPAETGSDTGDEALLHLKGSPLGRARAFATLCRAAKFPARLATGFEINKPDAHKANRTQPRTWVDVYVADPQKPAVGRWVPYDPNNGALHVLDYNIVPVYYSVRDVDLVRVSNSTDVATSYSIEGIPGAARESVKTDGRATLPTARLLAAYPETTRYCRVPEPKIDAPKMEPIRTRIHSAAARKDVVLRATHEAKGQLTCTISFRLHLDRKGDWRQTPFETPLKGGERTRYLAKATGMTPGSTTAQEMVARLRDDRPGPQELADKIFRKCLTDVELVRQAGEEEGRDGGDEAILPHAEAPRELDSGDEALAKHKGSALGRARAFCALCRAAQLPARLVTGFEIQKRLAKMAGPIQPRTWVEVYLADPQKPSVERWVPYDPNNGALHELDYNVVPVRHDAVELVRVTNSTGVHSSYSIESMPPPTRTFLSILDLRHLPGKLHDPIKVVLILPIGALFTAFVRTIVGIRTFGTFSPTLLALAFVYNDWRTGLCIFFVVIATGFVSRSLLDRLRLLLVPRLGIILTLVVMLMVLSIAVMNYFHGLPSKEDAAQTVLLPMVILTNLVERFYVTSEEDSIFQAVRLLLTSVLMALAIYLLLSSPALGNLLFDYPELHFFTVAILVLMGRYTGYRVTELVRFRDLVRPPEGPPG